VNTYARSKVRGEELAQEAADAGLLVNTCRLSSVYGCPLDHKDRVAMAFAGAAALGGTIVLEGVSNTFDFTDVRDVAKGVELLVQATMAGERMPPIHFVSGKGTTLIDLAEMAQAHALTTVTMREAPPRDFDVAHFVGDPARAKSLLGWSAEIEIEDGMRRLISRMADHHAAGHSGERMTGSA
jgi:nucleoside-diphosphate-sugar epimerase